MLFCPDCGYDLQGITSDRCPECGIAIDRAALSRSQIPWSHRKQLGRWRAYWKTVWLVSWHPRRFADEVERPQSYREARMFQRLTVVGCIAPFVLILLVWLISGDPGEANKLTDDLRDFIWQPMIDVGVWAIPLAGAALIAALVVLTGVPSYFFHPRSMPMARQNAAICLSYYPGGLLTVSALLAACEWGISLAADRLVNLPSVGPRPAPVVFEVSTALLLSGALFLFGAYFVVVLILLRGATGCGFVRLACALTATIIAPVATAVFLTALPNLAYEINAMLGL